VKIFLDEKGVRGKEGGVKRCPSLSLSFNISSAQQEQASKEKLETSFNP